MAERVKGISTHVLDSSRGIPAMGIPVKLEIKRADLCITIGESITDADGRCPDLLAGTPLTASTYQITFQLARYFDSQGLVSLYPEVIITFVVRETDAHHHIPLLVGPNTYTTYRGS